MFLYHKVCRACGFGKPDIPTLKESLAAGPKAASTALIPVFDLGVQPLANDFCKEGQERSGYAPLKVLFCPKCTLAQLSVVVRPDILYRHYAYITSKSLTMQHHFQALTDLLLSEQGHVGSVAEIGSNDGLFLKYLRNRGFGNLCGIDPAENLSKIAHDDMQIPTINACFDQSSALMARAGVGEPDFIVARHVFCHIDDWQGFISALDNLAGKQTLIAIEVPYAADVLSNGEFDTIYHEHTSYLSLRAMEALLKNTPFHIHRVSWFQIHGGAIVILLRRNDWNGAANPGTMAMIEKEKVTEDTWLDFGVKAQCEIQNLSDTIRDMAASGKTVIGYGASAKSTVWINACKFSRKEIRFICDNTPAKQYTVTPGTDIPITDDGAITRELPDYAILFAWNYKFEILEKEKLARSKGTKFIVPLPKFEIV